jgi:chemotaxis protein CheD
MDNIPARTPEDNTGNSKDHKIIDVGIGNLRVSYYPSTVLVAYGIGSCIIVCAHEPSVPVGGMAHILLPKGQKDEDGKNTMYADAAVPELIRRMKSRGARHDDITVSLVGGAKVIDSSERGGTHIGMRNVDEVRAILDRLKIPITSQHVGGTCSRTVRFYVKTGEAHVTSVKNKLKRPGTT